MSKEDKALYQQAMPGQTLTAAEQKFVAEAEAGFFDVVLFDDDGHPFVYGAPGTGNLFSMEVVEESEGGESLYYLREEEAE